MTDRLKRWAYPAALVAVVAGLSVAAYFLMPWMVRIATDEAARGEFLGRIRASGAGGVATLAGLLCLQVVVPILPAEFLQLGAGILYGAFGGALVCLAGLTAGTMANYALGRFLGAGLLSVFVKPDKLEKAKGLVSGTRADTVVFLLYFIPGIPKDVVAYAAGLSRYPAARFLLVSLVARFPSLLSSTFVGARLAAGDTGSAILVFLALAVVAVPAFFLSERILNRIAKPKDRTVDPQEDRP